MDTPINDKLSGKQTHCRDSLDAHVCLVHKTIMQHCIGTTTDHADEQVRNHAVLHIHNYTLWNGQQQLLTDKYTSKSYVNKCMKSSGKISPKTERKKCEIYGQQSSILGREGSASEWKSSSTPVTTYIDCFLSPRPTKEMHLYHWQAAHKSYFNTGNNNNRSKQIWQNLCIALTPQMFTFLWSE